MDTNVSVSNSIGKNIGLLATKRLPTMVHLYDLYQR